MTDNQDRPATCKHKPGEKWSGGCCQDAIAKEKETTTDRDRQQPPDLSDSALSLAHS